MISLTEDSGLLDDAQQSVRGLSREFRKLKKQMSAAFSGTELTKYSAALKKTFQDDLAAFDQLDVLELEKVTQSITASAGQTAQWQAQTDALTIIQQQLNQFWESYQSGASQASSGWNSLTIQMTDSFSRMVPGIVQTFSGLVLTIAGLLSGNLPPVFQGLAQAFTGVWQTVYPWFQTAVLSPLQSAFPALWSGMSGSAGLCWTQLQTLWGTAGGWFGSIVTGPVGSLFQALWTVVKTSASAAWTIIRTVWALVSPWFQKWLFQPVKAGFSELWKQVQQGMEQSWGAMTESLTGYLNQWIELLERFAGVMVQMVNSIIDALNTIEVNIPSWVPELGGRSFSVNLPHAGEIILPRLATGAVLPPNAAFAAVLGDQRNGRNLEAPESLIRQIVREESAGQDVTIKFTGNLAQLARVLYPAVETENRRRGRTLISGGTVW